MKRLANVIRHAHALWYNAEIVAARRRIEQEARRYGALNALDWREETLVEPPVPSTPAEFPRQRTQYRGIWMTPRRAADRALRDNHFALRNVVRALWQAYRGDPDPRWKEVEQLLKE